MVPEGRYMAKAVGTPAVGRTKTGTEEVCVEFEILDGPYAKQRLPWYGYFGPKSEDRTINSLLLCGWDGQSMKHWNGISKNTVSITVEHKPSQDGTKTFARVAWVNDSNGARVGTPMNALELSAFEQRIKTLAAQAGAKAPPPATFRIPPHEATAEEFFGDLATAAKRPDAPNDATNTTSSDIDNEMKGDYL